MQTQGYQSTISLVLCGSAPGYPPPYSPLPPTGVRVLPGAELRLGVLYHKKLTRVSCGSREPVYPGGRREYREQLALVSALVSH